MVEIEKPEEYFVTRYELECKLREIDQKLSGAVNDASRDASTKNGIISDKVNKDTLFFEKRVEDIHSRIQAINDRLDKFLIAIISIALTTLVSLLLILVSFILGR